MEELQAKTEYVDVSVVKRKLGPVTARYGIDGYNDVNPRLDVDKPSRKALVGLDNSHSSDFKVAYASDPVLVVHGDGCRSHEELRKLCESHDLLPQQANAIELPYGSQEWRSGFTSLPRDASWFDRYADRLREATERDMDYRRQEHTATGYIPKE